MGLQERAQTGEMEAARAAAQRLLVRTGLGGTLPVPVVRLADDVGLKVFRAPPRDPNVSGMLVPEDGAYVIYVNAEDAPVRRRFTIAHEIGHWELHRQEVSDRLIDTRDDLALPTFMRSAEATPRERAANVFAAELLMPTAQVRDLAPRFGVEALARMFQVSQAAMAIRLDELG